MNAHTQQVNIKGPVGNVDTALDLPEGACTGVAIVAHPHPLYGGTRDNKVVQTLARVLLGLGHVVWRPNFRGVGETAGVHDHGKGETDDLLAVIDHALAHESVRGLTDSTPRRPALVLAGFSFGSFVLSRVVPELARRGQPVDRLIFVGTAVSRFEVQAVPAGTLVIHGEVDDTVPLTAVMDWARPQDLPVVVIPGADHFFHRKLNVLKAIVLGAWGVPPAGGAGLAGNVPQPAPQEDTT